MSVGTHTCALSDVTASEAISASVLACGPKGLIWISSAIPLTPSTRWAARSTAHFSA